MQKPVVQVGTTIAASPHQVWQAMRRGAMFPGTTIDTDWKVGHPIVFNGEWQGRKFTDRGEIQTLSEDQELSFTHWSEKDGEKKRPPSWHIVHYRLEPAGQRTKVTLSQFNEGEKTDVDAKTKAEFEKNWTMMLEGLKKTAEAN
jgi:uncharacterized protein YndB with AHSA1/START domain